MVRRLFAITLLFVFFASCISPKQEAEYTSREPIPTSQRNAVELVITEERFTEPSVPLAEKNGVPQPIQNWQSHEMLDYRIGPGDVVRIAVLVSLEAKSYEVMVASDGTVVLPLIGPFPVGDRTVEEARADMREAFSEYYINPQVQLRVVEFNSQKVYIVGVGKGDGYYPLKKRTTLFEVLNSIQNLIESVDFEGVYLMRDGKIYPLHVERLLAGDLSTNYELLSNDILYLPSRKNMKVYLLGEVKKPGMYNFDKKENLFYLLAKAGGPTSGAQLREIRIIRGGLEDPTLITVNINPLMKRRPASQLRSGNLAALAVGVEVTRKSAVSLEKLYLTDGDIVFVPRTALEKWNTILKQISPSLNFLARPVLITREFIYLQENL